jgi:hypothetical protein
MTIKHEACGGAGCSVCDNPPDETTTERLDRIDAQLLQHGGVDSDDMEWLTASLRERDAAITLVADRIRAQVKFTRDYLIADGTDRAFADILLAHYNDFASELDQIAKATDA